MTLSTPIVAGNWKLHHGPSATTAFFREFLPLLPTERRASVAFFPPALSLPAAADALTDRADVLLGVQNIYWETSGAFTGETSASMAAEAGARLALIGHSERRHVFGESDAEVRRKIRTALDAGLDPILCVGETLEQRDSGAATEIVGMQLESALSGLTGADFDRLIIAYEPVWAIGTGRAASPDDAAQMHRHARQILVRHSDGARRTVPILYGGSVKPDNASALLAAPEVDGLLVGGASLVPAEFALICAAADQVR